MSVKREIVSSFKAIINGVEFKDEEFYKDCINILDNIECRYEEYRLHENDEFVSLVINYIPSCPYGVGKEDIETMLRIFIKDEKVSRRTFEELHETSIYKFLEDYIGNCRYL